eukprot:Nk52_evm1s151 gene=Nk52_evmTU1s151
MTACRFLLILTVLLFGTLVAVDAKPMDRGSEATKSVNLTLYSSGAAYSYPIFAATKQTVAQNALLLFTRLPSDKSKTNFTWVSQQLNFQNPAVKRCNTSAFHDICQNLKLSSRVLTLSNSTLPIGWPETVTYLAKMGLKHIEHFSTFGCLPPKSSSSSANGGIAISRYGMTIGSLTLAQCPPIPKASPADVSSSSAQNTNCWNVPWTKKFGQGCVLQTGVPDVSLALLSGAYNRYKLNKAISEYGDTLSDYLNKWGRWNDNWDSFLQTVGLEGREVSGFLTNLPTGTTEEIYKAGVKAAGRDTANIEIRQLKRNNVRRAKQLAEAETEMKKLEVQLRAEAEAAAANGDAETVDAILQDIDEMQADLGYARQLVANSPDEVRAIEAEDNMNRVVAALQKGCLYPVDEPLSTDTAISVPPATCDIDQSSEGILFSQESTTAGTADGTIAYTNEGIATIEGDFPQIGDSTITGGDRSLAMPTSAGDSAFEDMASLIGGEMISSLLMFGIINQDVAEAVHTMVSQTKAGFKKVVNAISEISQQSYEEYKAVVNEIKQKINYAEASILCQNAYDDFDKYMGFIFSDYARMKSAFQSCKQQKNLTGKALNDCEYDYFSPVMKHNFDKYTMMGNMHHDDWKRSLAGNFAYECNKFAVIRGLPAEEVVATLQYTHNAIRDIMYKGGMVMSWISFQETLYYAAHNNKSYVDNTVYLKEAQQIISNQTRDFTLWFRDQVVPPALSVFMPSSWWASGLKTRNKVPVPQARRFQVQILDKSTFQSKGLLTPLAWLPETPVSSLSSVDTASNSNPYPPGFQIVKIQNSKNVTASVISICESIPCLDYECSCNVFTPTPCTCSGDTCSCEKVFIEHAFSSRKPSRGWAGPYLNSTKKEDASHNVLPPGMTACGNSDKDTDCIPGVFITPTSWSGISGGISFFANSTHRMHLPGNKSYEVGRLGVYEGDMLFQFTDAFWSFKYGKASQADYLHRYFDEEGYGLANLNVMGPNSTSLNGGDQWRFNWAVASTSGRWFPVNINYAQTNASSTSDFGFSCVHDWSPSDPDCKLHRIGLKYPNQIP